MSAAQAQNARQPQPLEPRATEQSGASHGGSPHLDHQPASGCRALLQLQAQRLVNVNCDLVSTTGRAHGHHRGAASLRRAARRGPEGCLAAKAGGVHAERHDCVCAVRCRERRCFASRQTRPCRRDSLLWRAVPAEGGAGYCVWQSSAKGERQVLQPPLTPSDPPLPWLLLREEMPSDIPGGMVVRTMPLALGALGWPCPCCPWCLSHRPVACRNAMLTPLPLPPPLTGPCTPHTVGATTLPKSTAMAN